MRKYAREWIEKYPSIARLNEVITGPRRMGSSGTVQSYVFGVKRFVEFLGLPDPEVALEKFRTGELNAGGEADKYIDSFLKGHAHKTVLSQLYGVKKWLSLNGVKVDWEKIDMPTGAVKQEEDRAPTKEELKVLLGHASRARDRATILVLASSGLRVGTLATLTVGDVSLDYPDVARIKVESKSGRKFIERGMAGAGKFYSTFITPEAKQALLEYFKEREVAGEKLTPKSPLIGSAYHNGKFCSVNDLEHSWHRLLKRSSLADKSQRWYQLHLHTLRKYFRSNLVGVDESYRESWMGHKGKYLDDSYFRAEESRHLAEYRKTIQYLTVYGTPIEQKNLIAQAMKAIAARYEGVTDDQLKKIDEIFARAKDVDEAIQEFRRFSADEPEKKPRTMQDGNGKYLVAKSEEEMIQRLHDGYRLVQSLNHDKYLLEAAS